MSGVLYISILGEESITLRFNYIARVNLEEKVSRNKAIEILRKLPKKVTGKYGENYGFQDIDIQAMRYTKKYMNNLLNKLIATTYHFRVAKKREVSRIYIYWVYPDFIVFNGRKDVVERAVTHFTNSLERLGLVLTFDRLDFEWFYLLKVFEICQEMGIWRKGNLVNRGIPPELAQGIIVQTIEDVSTEWEKESTQAKIVVAKGAHDCTCDLSTGVTILQGRDLKSLIAVVEMEENQKEVRLSKGGSILIRVSHASKDARTSQYEVARLLWGLELTQRLYFAHSDWLKLSLEERLPHEDVYRRTHEMVVKEIEPVLTKSLDTCLKKMKDLREELKRQEEDISLESERLSEEV